ncbi:MAG: response regulator transcription factor [Verrucomicrobiae bacterium]|nr:response regulator transcription factor [Verrucomicrobiae bacterium]MCP5532300.1 response regulator transcription factor [Akkermansiaceae bacterium]
MPMIRVSIVEDDRATREGFAKLLRHDPEILCQGIYASAEEAEREIPSLLPDVVLMDISLPGRSGVECVARLKNAHPQLQFVMVTTYDTNQLIFDALRAGASGYLLKRTAPDDLLPAIKDVHGGGSPMSMQIARKVVSHFHQIQQPAGELETLTKREHEILALLAKGLAYKEIAEQLFISRGTVHRHLHAVYEKLHVQSGKEAVVKYLGR